jgi:hypothetical protein
MIQKSKAMPHFWTKMGHFKPREQHRDPKSLENAASGY